MNRPAHAPYATGVQSFSIGLKPLDPADWIEADNRLGAYLGEKRQLLETVREEVWAAEEDTLTSQLEVRDALIAYLLEHPSGRWVRDGEFIRVLEEGAEVASAEIRPDDPAPLLTAALLVQEDLCLMRKGADGWRLAAGSVSFASSWSFKARFGQTLDGLHAYVPGYPDRLAQRMARIFDNLHVGKPVWRLNWSLYGDGELHHPHGKGPMPFAKAEEGGDEGWLDHLFVRVERQTLMRMPVSGDILFTIRIHVDPLRALSRHPDRAVLAESLRRQLDALDADQLAYKGLTQHREKLGKILSGLC